METPKKKGKLDKCRVCGDAAFFSFFGVISCSACKMFFKRYGDKRDVSKPVNHLFTVIFFVYCVDKTNVSI